MRLLFCFLSYVSPELRLAGGTTHFTENLKRWCNSHVEVRIMTTKDGALLLKRVHAKCNLETVVSGTPFLAKSGIGVAITLLLRAIEVVFRVKPNRYKIEAEAICTESHFLPDVLAAILARRNCPRAAVIGYLHHIIPRPNERYYHPLLPSVISWSAQALSLALMKHYGFYIFTFPAVKSQLLAMGFSEEKIRCISNGIDTECIKRIPEVKRRFDACFLGNALPRKGILDLPQVWRHVCNNVPHAKLAIMGTGREQDIERLKKNFIDQKLENNVHFFGYLPEDEKIATLKASSLFLFPSYEEGWGIVVGEAMACGLPVIAYDLPAYSAIFQRGIVTVPIGSIGGLASVAISLLKDERRRLELGEQGKLQASEYNLDRIAAMELSLIRKICSNETASGRRLALEYQFDAEKVILQ